MVKKNTKKDKIVIPFNRVPYHLYGAVGIVKANLYSMIDSLATNELGYAYASQAYMARMLGTTREKVRRNINSLIEDGYIIDLDAGKRNKRHRLKTTGKSGEVFRDKKKKGELFHDKEVAGNMTSGEAIRDKDVTKHALIRKEKDKELEKEEKKILIIKYLQSNNVNKTILQKTAKKLNWDLKLAKLYFEQHDTGTAIIMINNGDKPDGFEDREKYLKGKFSDLIKS